MSARSIKVRAGFTFGGGGGGALGYSWAGAELFGVKACYELSGAFDFDPYACRAYEYLTGAPETQADARTMTPAEMRTIYGETAPRILVGSAPCKASSGLLSKKKAAEPEYEEMSLLLEKNVDTILAAWPDEPPWLLIFENVPNIETRAKAMLKRVCRKLRAAGYVLQRGFHECRTAAGLAQNRKRWFMVARLARRVPCFLYKPPRKNGKVCGDVLGPLPLPGDPKGGPMHELPAISMLNWLRLWAIPAGGDWRDLIADGRPRRGRFRRYHVERWRDPSVTVNGPGTNGAYAVQDERVEGDVTPDAPPMQGDLFADRGVPPTPWSELGASRAIPDAGQLDLFGTNAGRFGNVDRVTGWSQPFGTVTSSPAPSSGAPACADPRVPVDMGIRAPTPEELKRWEREGVAAPGRTNWFSGSYRVGEWDKPSGAVIGGPCNGANYIADPRVPVDLVPPNGARNEAYGVIDPAAPSGTVTGEAAPSTGRFAIADSRVASEPVDLGRRYTGDVGFATVDKVTPWDAPTGAVTGAKSPRQGAISVAAPPPLRPQAGNDKMHWGKYVVVPWDGTAHTVTGASRVGSGAQSIAAPISTTGFRGRWGVLRKDEPAGTVTGNARVNTGAFSIADDVPPTPPTPVKLVPDKPPFDHAYAVLRADEPSPTVAGTSDVGCGAYAVADEVPKPVDLSLGCEPRAGVYGVTPMSEPSPTVVAHANIDNSTSAIADDRPAGPPAYVVLSYEETKRIVDGEITVPIAIVDPENPGEPLAIVDDLKKSPYRWVETRTEKHDRKGRVRIAVKRQKRNVPLVLISADGYWHRPLTTLELAVLQSLPWWHRGAALDFGGGSTAARELIGNMIPALVGKAIGEQMLLAVIAAEEGLFYLDSGGSGVWVRPEMKAALERAGIVAFKRRKLWHIGGAEVLDDGAVKRRMKKKAKVTRTRPAATRRSAYVPEGAVIQ